jgi:hypothetical protein
MALFSNLLLCLLNNLLLSFSHRRIRLSNLLSLLNRLLLNLPLRPKFHNFRFLHLLIFIELLINLSPCILEGHHVFLILDPDHSFLKSFPIRF